ncbi:DEAD/DEAH box helicase [Streptomyces sp. SAJ15]|uniref:DEAD/DEAH box helicase n=1 Tax=Streptomyces sp. SAJ15 TaxID=2011095 RepID=UPI0011858F59|nr:DEAD/DEAH box helicase [Streptomyces sp. SAJ15]TVL92572.1 RNA helicase [Streptomyces sp. SAJ15]
MSISTDNTAMPSAVTEQVEQDEQTSAAAVEAIESQVETGAEADIEVEADNEVDADVEADAEADDQDAAPQITFGDLGLPEQIVRKLAQNGVTTPFPIQAATIPDALAGKDILGRGRTGSGKTLSFGLPLLTTLAGGHTEKKRPRGLILTPTRELAMQVSDALQPYGDVLGLKLKVVCGGTSMGNQIYALERGVDILVATPGRLRDIIDRGAASLDKVQVAVLDEADQMADMGFLPEVTEILDLVPQGGQRLLFSATLENEIDTLVKRYLVDQVTHEVDPSAGAVSTMTHHVLVVKPKDKAPVTAAIAARKGRTIIFVRTQLGADRVADQLREAGVRADALHGGMTQGARTRTLADFKDGYVNVLVATDVAARGIHVDGIDLVLNVDPAGDHKDYLHRSGRTARAGQSGTVVSLALPHQRRQIFRLMEDAGVDASRHIVGGAGAFDEDVARITGARSLTEVQAESAANSAKQAEREVQQLTRELEKVQRRALELREEADRLAARVARERGEAPEAAVAASSEEAVTAAETPVVPHQAPAAEVETAVVAEEAPRRASSYERRDERGNFERRDRERGFDRDRDRGFNRDRRDDRGFDRDRDRDRGFGRDRREDRGDRGGDRGGFNRERRDGDRGGFGGGRSFERRDDRGNFNRDRDRRDDRGFDRDRDRDRGFGRDRREDRGDRGGDRGGFNRERRDGDRGGFGGGRSFERRDDRQGRSFERRDHNHRGGDRPFHRERREDRPFNRDDRPFNRDRRDDRPARRDDHRGARPFDRRADKPRWKRNG